MSLASYLEIYQKFQFSNTTKANHLEFVIFLYLVC